MESTIPFIYLEGEQCLGLLLRSWVVDGLCWACETAITTPGFHAMCECPPDDQLFVAWDAILVSVSAPSGYVGAHPPDAVYTARLYLNRGCAKSSELLSNPTSTEPDQTVSLVSTDLGAETRDVVLKHFPSLARPELGMSVSYTPSFKAKHPARIYMDYFLSLFKTTAPPREAKPCAHVGKRIAKR